MPQITEDRVLDARGLLCPMPVVRTSKEIKTLRRGQVLKVLATDRGAIVDFKAWAEDTGNPLLEWTEQDGVLVFYIRRGDEES